MYLKTFNIVNFKSFKNVKIHFNEDLNIITGVNNSGKTTVLEALALWHECFTKLIRVSGRGAKNHKKGDWILGNTNDRYFSRDDISSVRSPNQEDIFNNGDTKNKIEISANLISGAKELEIRFRISSSSGKYIIELVNFRGYDFAAFNTFFKNLPDPFSLYYSSPVASILQSESFFTPPQISEFITTRRSSDVIRNRLYRLYQTTRFSEFQSDLSYILYGSTSATLRFVNKSDIQVDPRVLIHYTMNGKDKEKDIALLGSGTLQSIEILLNIYQQGEEKRDLNIVLLDEPDSHIHRDIQKRLLEVLTKFSKDNQIFISTHNESLIRSSQYKYLFHLDGKSTADISSIDSGNLDKSGISHFSGIYPSQINPLIKSIGGNTGLDIINAIEADRLIFVEGEDDARVYSHLLQQIIGNNNRKFMFWVLGGINRVFRDINSYQKVFSNIKNSKTLWEKAVLIFDKDDLSLEHKNLFVDKLKTILSLESFAFNGYTQEAVIFTDTVILNELLLIWINSKGKPLLNEVNLYPQIESAYQGIKPTLEERYNKANIDKNVPQYIGKFIEQTKDVFGTKKPVIDSDKIKVLRHLETYYSDVLKSGRYYELMTKKDVASVINSIVQSFGLVFSESDYFDLIKFSNKSLWYKDWDFLNSI